MELKSIIKCFKLPSKIGNVLIPSNSASTSHPDEGADSAKIHPQLSRSEAKSIEESGVSRSDSISDSVVELGLKDGLSNSTLLDLGEGKFGLVTCEHLSHLFFPPYSQDILCSWSVSTKKMCTYQ